VRNPARQLREILGIGSGGPRAGTVLSYDASTGTARIAIDGGGETVVRDTRAWRTGQRIIVGSDGAIIGKAPPVSQTVWVD
jgi:hypothetical protein